MKAPAIQLALPADILAQLVDWRAALAHRDSGLISTRSLMGAPREPTLDEAAQLALHGVLDYAEPGRDRISSRFAEAADVIIAPNSSLTVRVWADGARGDEIDLQTNVQFANGHGVALNQLADGRYRLASPVARADVQNLVKAAFFQRAAAVENNDLNALFESSTAAAFFACIDLLRETGGDTIEPTRLARQLAPPPIGSQRFSTYLPLVTGCRETWNTQTIERELQHLVSARLLRSDNQGASFRATGLLAGLAAASLPLSAALHWHLVELPDARQITLTNLVALLLGDSVLLTLELCNDGLVAMQAPDLASLSERLLFTHQITANGPPEPTPPPSNEAEAKEEADWYYVIDGRPHGPVPEHELRDLFKRKALQRSALVWTESMSRWEDARNTDLPPAVPDDTGGHRAPLPPPLPAESVKAAAKFCPACGSALRPDLKFCTHCGASTVRLE